MRVLGIDSGAKRAGWAVIEDGPKYIDSGVIECTRGAKEAYQDYRMKLAQKWCVETIELIDQYRPDILVTETVPVYGMNDNAQGYLANVMATVMHVTCWVYQPNIKVKQISAVKVQNEIGIKGRGKKMTKPNVRSGVVEIFPDLKNKLMSNIKVFEESDAIAIATYTLNNI